MSSSAIKLNRQLFEQNNEPYSYIKYTQRPSTTAKTKKERQSKSQQKSSRQRHFQSSFQQKSQTDMRRSKFVYQTLYTRPKPNQEQTDHKKSIDETDKQESFALQMLKQNLDRLQKMQNSTNDVMKEMIKSDIIAELLVHDPFFRKLDKHLVESLVLIGKITIYEEGEHIIRQQNSIGFLLYGRVKIYSPDYKMILIRGDNFGQHILFDTVFPLKSKSLEDSCFLWLPKKYYLLLREQSIKSGLKAEVNQLEVLLRLSFIKKKFKEHLKKIHI